MLTNTGKVDEAIAAYDKAIQIDPNRADAYYWKGVDMIGKATMKDNKMVAPKRERPQAFNKYLELQPTGKYADAAKQMLGTIGASVQTSSRQGQNAEEVFGGLAIVCEGRKHSTPRFPRRFPALLSFLCLFQ